MITFRSTLGIAAATACTLALAGAIASADTPGMPSTLVVTMNAQNGSGESGTATLTQEKHAVQVVIALKNATGSQPSHIHEGTCAKLNPAPKFPLNNTVDGKGTSVVKGVTIADLVAGGLAINVHKSASDLATYVSCGDITAQ